MPHATLPSLPGREENSGDDDGRVLAAARSGDRAAFGTLYQRYRSYSEAIARRNGVTGHDVDDVVNDAWTRLLVGFSRGSGPDRHFSGYLAQTVRSCAVDRWRATRRLILTDSPNDFADPVTEAEPDDETLEAARRAMTQLAAEQRELLEASFADGFSAANYARRFGLTPNAVANRAVRARRSLRRAYFAA